MCCEIGLALLCRRVTLPGGLVNHRRYIRRVSVAHPFLGGALSCDIPCQWVALSSGMPKLRHFDDSGVARFVTFTCFRRHGYLSTAQTRQTVIQALVFTRVKKGIQILGWVIMPEHMHLVLAPPPGVKLGDAIGRLKHWTARHILKQIRDRSFVLQRGDGSPAVWQRRCYDHNCHTIDSVRQKIGYCHTNPVRRGLVDEPGRWPWSSYNWYRDEEPVLLDIDGIKL
jgi:putative transposase